MNAGSKKESGKGAEERRSAGEFLRNYDSDSLAAHLVECRGRARKIMFEFNIPMGHICEMARLADERISDTALRSEFLRALIDVHEFGREAKRRGSSVVEKGGQELGDATEGDGPSDSSQETSLFATNREASDGVAEEASRDFFSSLDMPRRPDPATRKRPPS
ncbi:MAG: hypothetical protein ACMVO3_08340 [Thalassobaculum sp.]